MRKASRTADIETLFAQAREDVVDGSLTRWLRTHREALEAQCHNGRVDWKLFMSVIERLDLRDRHGEPPSLPAVKKAWQRIRHEAPIMRRRVRTPLRQKTEQAPPAANTSETAAATRQAAPMAVRTPDPTASSDPQPSALPPRTPPDRRIKDARERLERGRIPMPSRPQS